MPNRRKFDSLKVTDISDREVLWWLHDAADDDGWASSKEIAENVGKGMWADPDSAHKIVSARLSWLMRYGAVAREHLEKDGQPMYHKNGRPKYGQRWRLLPWGEAWMRSRMSRGLENGIAKLQPHDFGVVIEAITDDYHRLDPTAQALLRRQWTFSTRRS